MHSLAFLGGIGWQEILILMVVGLLIFGRRLPQTARSLGMAFVEFRKGLRGDPGSDPAFGSDTITRGDESANPRALLATATPSAEQLESRHS